MTGAFLVEPGNVELSPIINKKNEKPLVVVDACGVCATDRKAFNSPPACMALPRILGHECCGTLISRVGTLLPGTRVALWPALACGSCPFCQTDRPQLCADLQLFGLHRHGAYADTLAVPAHQWDRLHLLPLPAALSNEQAVFAEPLGCVLHALRMVATPPERLMIYGAGLMGRLAAQAARHCWPAAEIVVYESNRLRRHALAAESRISLVDRPMAADLIFIACSSVEAVQQALDQLAPGGMLLLFSGLPNRDKGLTVDHNRLHRQEQIMRGCYGCTPRDMALALNLMADGHVVVDALISKTISLSEVGRELAATPGLDQYKTILMP